MDTIPHSPVDAHRVLRDFARLLAPYIAEELARPLPEVSTAYDTATCELFVSELGTPVIDRSLRLFGYLSTRGKISSVELAEMFGMDSPRSLPGSLTTPLKKRAKKLGLPLPFDGGEGQRPYGGIPAPTADDDPKRTYWADRDGIAARMVEALRTEAFTRPDSGMQRFVWRDGDVEFLTPEQAGRLGIETEEKPS